MKQQPQPQRIVRVIQGPPPELKPLNVEQFRKECLDAHNRYRAMHGCPPLKLNAQLDAFAKEWCESLAKRNKMEHRPNNEYGENLYMAENVDVPGELPVKRWYDEIQQYDFNKAKFSPNVGHFTQLIWKNTTDVGIAVLRQGNQTYVVANYDPPGNFQGQFKEMVPRKLRN